MNITTHSVGVIAKERGGNQQLAKSTKGLEQISQGDKPTKNFKELRKIAR